MAGICALCNNLEGVNIYLNDELLENCHCKAAKYNKDGIEGYYSKRQVLKQSKSISEIQDKCDSWDDRLKGKDTK